MKALTQTSLNSQGARRGRDSGTACFERPQEHTALPSVWSCDRFGLRVGPDAGRIAVGANSFCDSHHGQTAKRKEQENFAGGILLESTRQSNRPRRIQVNRVAAGMSEALRLMTEGERLRVWIPRDLAEFGAFATGHLSP